MEVTVHFPETEEGMLELRENVEEAHAQIIINYIKKLDCSEVSRTFLFDYLRKKALEMSNFKEV